MKQPTFIQTWGALIVVCLGIFIITLDGTMMNVAAATIAELPPKVRESLEQILPSVNVNAQKTTLESVFDFILMGLLSSAFLAGKKLRSKKAS